MLSTCARGGVWCGEWGGSKTIPMLPQTLSRPWFSITALSVMFGLVVIHESASTPESDQLTSTWSQKVNTQSLT